ncbi:MAG TPA: hypothetical protein VLA02_06010 [Reyranella sp.]|nr:hypothetical protein [Reyranella sp.]
MFPPKMMAALSVGFLAAACAGPYDRQASMPVRAVSISQQNCLDYGFVAGSGPYDRCVQREASARAAGRMDRSYAEARLVEDARGACHDYGLQQGTQRYDNCVGREVDARRYREQGQTTASAPYYAPQYTPAPAAAPYYVEQRAAATTGTPVFQDEFGFRYDAEGNRLDRRGRIISPQSTVR